MQEISEVNGCLSKAQLYKGLAIQYSYKNYLTGSCMGRHAFLKQNSQSDQALS